MTVDRHQWGRGASRRVRRICATTLYAGTRRGRVRQCPAHRRRAVAADRHQSGCGESPRVRPIRATTLYAGGGAGSVVAQRGAPGIRGCAGSVGGAGGDAVADRPISAAPYKTPYNLGRCRDGGGKVGRAGHTRLDRAGAGCWGRRGVGSGRYPQRRTKPHATLDGAGTVAAKWAVPSILGWTGPARGAGAGVATGRDDIGAAAQNLMQRRTVPGRWRQSGRAACVGCIGLAWGDGGKSDGRSGRYPQRRTKPHATLDGARTLAANWAVPSILGWTGPVGTISAPPRGDATQLGSNWVPTRSLQQPHA
jgi:hypothetical protein